MELFDGRRLVLVTVQWSAVVFMTNPKNYDVHVLPHSVDYKPSRVQSTLLGSYLSL